LFSWDTLRSVLWAVATLIAGLLLGRIAARIRARYFGWLPTHGGWMALLAACAFTFVTWRSRPALGAAGRTAWEWLGPALDDIRQGDAPGSADSEQLTAALVLLGSAILALSIVIVFLRRLPDCWRDVQAVLKPRAASTQPSAKENASTPTPPSSPRWI